jgi:hypothetical protein
MQAPKVVYKHVATETHDCTSTVACTTWPRDANGNATHHDLQHTFDHILTKTARGLVLTQLDSLS